MPKTTKKRAKPKNLDNFTLYTNTLKAIYLKGEKGATREDVKTYLQANLYYDIEKQSLSNLFKNISISPYLSRYIDCQEDKRPYRYMIKADFLSDGFLRLFIDSSYSYDEFLTYNTLDYLNKDNSKALNKAIKDNFICLDNPLVDTKMSELELKYTKEILKLMDKKLKAKITMKGGKTYIVIFLKIIYSDKNWYALVKHDDESIGFKRLAFMEDIEKQIASNYSSLEIPDNLDTKLKSLNNALSDYNNIGYEKTAKLEISKNIEHYFQKNMKQFFKHQKIINQNPLTIEVKYTSELEILRFVKSWLPDIKILEPIDLANSLKQTLQSALESYKQ